MALKERISSPLEAGLSILDAHHLPPHLTPALEYTSSRLAKKSLHLSLVIVRRDYQLPTIVPSHVSPGICGSSTPTSPLCTGDVGNVGGTGRLAFASSSPVVALKHLVRSASRRLSKRGPNETLQVGKPAQSPGYFPANPLESPKFRWPGSPTSPLSPPPMTPSTTTSLTSMATSDSNGPPTPHGGILHFLYASDMSPQVEKVMKSTISKAGINFGLGSAWLCPFQSPSARELTDQLFQNSVVQNEALFSSDGLTLLALDRLYSVKSALSSYSKTGFPLRLEDAVDELRRYVLASNGGSISKSDLFRSYDWLNVSGVAAADLDCMYRRAYGGPERFGGIIAMSADKISEPNISMSSFDDDSTDDDDVDDDDDDDDDDDNEDDKNNNTNDNDTHENEKTHKHENQNHNEYENDKKKNYDDEFEEISPSDTILDPRIVGVAMTAVQLSKPPTPRRIGPQHLKVQTAFEHKSNAKAHRGGEEDEDQDQDQDRTARPLDRSAVTQQWSSRCTIDQILTAQPLSSHPVIFRPRPVPVPMPAPERNLSREESMTPNAYDDISPITRSEWGFLMVDKGFRGAGRTAVVETC